MRPFMGYLEAELVLCTGTKKKNPAERNSSVCDIETCFSLERCYRLMCTIACFQYAICNNIFLLISICMSRKFVVLVFFFFEIQITQCCQHLCFPLRFFVIVYFDFFCRKLNAAVIDRTPHKSKHTIKKHKNTSQESQVHVPSMLFSSKSKYVLE